MKPERTRDQLKSVGIARARMYLKGHLEWLDGAPVAQSPGQIRWKLRPQAGALTADTVIVVDRELLRQSHAVLQKLTRHFPKAMYKLVGDVAEWSARVDSFLSRLKSAVHDDAELTRTAATPIRSLSKTDRILVERLIHHDPSLGSLLNQVIWSGWYNPSACSGLIRWIAENTDWIGEYLRVAAPESAETIILLAGDLVLAEPDTAALIQSTLAETSCYRTLTESLVDEINWFTSRLRDWRSTKAIPSRPRQVSGVTFGVHVDSFIRWLAAQDRFVRQRATRLANLVFAAPLARQWQSGWDKYHSAAHTAIRGLCQQIKNSIGNTAFHAEACRVAFELEQELAVEPTRFPIADVLNRVKLISCDYSARFNQALCDLLELIPVEHAEAGLSGNGAKLRLALLREATEFSAEHQSIRYFELSKQFLRSCRDVNRLRPWDGLVTAWDGNGYVWSSPRKTLVQDLPCQSQWVDFFSLLARLAGNANYSYRLNEELAWLVVASANVDQAYDRFIALSPTGVLADCTKCQLHGAIELEAEDFPLLTALGYVGPSGQIDDSRLKSILKLHRHFKAAGWPDLIRSLLQMNRATELSQVAFQFQIAHSDNDPLPVSQAPTSSPIPDWVEHLPINLQAQIAFFIATFPNSRARIQKILDRHFPDPQQLRNEIAVLQQFESFPHIEATNTAEDSSLTNSKRIPVELKRQRRLANLRQRLHQPLSVSESAILGLQKQLAEALVIDVFHDTRTRIVARLTNSLGGDSAYQEFSQHILPAPHLELVRGILDLDEPYRKYGLRLLRMCWGNVPWDLQQEPPNRRFLDDMIARGIRIEPWLGHRELIVAATDLHPQVTLAFESNEAEQLLMGYYFGTCLSPDEFNFFSAVANGVDVNKRVVYARDPERKVVGRCLFAIGDAGTIVVFRPYCHDSKFPFESHIAQFATNLANAMGTVVSHTDHVSPLLAPKWYDDGAYNLGNSIAAEESPVRLAIREATEETLIPSLGSALAPVGLTKSMLEVVVQLPELLARPQLIRPLIPLIQHVEQRWAISTLVIVARLAHRAGLRDIAVEILRRYAFDWIRRQMSHGESVEALETLKILSVCHPSIALRCLRETRERDIHRDEDEYDNDRRELFASSFEALGRQRAAREMRRRP